MQTTTIIIADTIDTDYTPPDADTVTRTPDYDPATDVSTDS